MSPKFLKTYNCILDVIQAFWRVAFVIRFSIAMSLLAGIALRFAGQSLEALRVLASTDSDSFQTWPRILFVVSSLILSLLSWYCARVLLYLIDPLPNAKGCAASAKGFLIRHLPRVIGALPLVFVAWALWAAAAETATVENNATLLRLLAFFSLLMAFLLYVFFHFRHWLIDRLKGRKGGAVEDQRSSQGGSIPGVSKLARSGKAVLLFAIFLWLSLLFIFSFESGRHKAVEVAIVIGPMAIVLLFAAAWIPVGSALAYAGKLTRLPLFSILIIFAFIFSAADWNDNHRVRYRLDPDETPAKRMDIHEGFKQWLVNRCDKENYKGGDNKVKYPVFIVSAEGGGLRAAYFASLVLSKLQDQDPAFAHHVFAISGVSGGSLGGAVFAALAHKYVNHDSAQPCNPQVNLPDTAKGSMSKLSDDVLGHDLLSPLLAATLYPDLLQRFLFFPVQRFDRSRAAEDALGYYWKRATGGDEFYKNFYLTDLYKDFARQSTPALFLNTTRVETGEQMVVSNLNPRSPEGSPNAGLNGRLNGLTSLADAHPAISMPLSTAAYLSARFPIVASAGYLPVQLKDKDGKIREGKFRYVDGGYFENSGTATVLDLLSALNIEEATRAAQVDIQIIIIRIGADQGELLYHRHGLGEITSPIFAVVNGGTARGTLSVGEMQTTLKERLDAATPTSQFNLRLADEAHFQVNQTNVKLPLGYLLSTEARADMDKQITKGDNLGSFNKVIDELKRTP
ncbi:MAG: hypothetical protein QOH63_1214 [Acidobacteriota bacterium]|jgi:hypothetical protein|nr:hypothetical protein [Acidobacteriota bacterium]